MTKVVRRWCSTLAVLLWFAGSAGAQVPPPPPTCSVNTSNTPTLRSEGITELVGDIVIICTGGPASTDLGSGGTSNPLAPAVNITVSLPAQVTSRLLNSAAVSEALLLIDEPNSGLPAPIPGFGPAEPFTPCPNPNATGANSNGCAGPLSPNPTYVLTQRDALGNAYETAVTSPCAGGTNATCLGGTTTYPTAIVPAPNVYQGVVSGNQVTFYGVPVVPMGNPNGARVFRITNVRVEASGISGAGTGSQPAQASILISNPPALPITNATPIVAFVQQSLSTSVAAPIAYAQCNSQTLTQSTVLTFKELFASAFKTRVDPTAPGQTGGSPTAGQGSQLVQNLSGTIYNSESGFTLGGAQAVVGTTGLADFGTRLTAVFTNIPAGARIFVSQFGVTTNSANGAVTGETSSGLSWAQAITNDAVPDGPTGIPAAAPISSSGSTVHASDGTMPTIHVVEITPATGNTATASWESISNIPTALDTYQFAVFITYVAGPGAPAAGTASANLRYGPASTVVTASSSANVPRFVDTSTTLSAIAITSCSTIPVTFTSSPSGANFTLVGSGCAPGNYTTPATTAWITQTSCTVNFADPLIVGGVNYAFHSSTVSGSAASHENPRTINSGATALTINATYLSSSGTSASTATHLSVIAQATATAGVPVSFTVIALDSMNNTVTLFTDPVHFTSTDSSGIVPGDVNLTNGVGTFTASLVTAGAQTLTASDLFSSSITGTSGTITVSAPSGFRFIPVTPCRVADTRNPAGPFGAPFITGLTSRSFTIPNSACGIPSTAQAYSLNVTVVPHGPLSYLTVWPTGQTQPFVSTLNSDGRIKANAAIVPGGIGGDISVFATNDTDVILDIDGYFVPASDASALVFYSMGPCRLVDTRINLLSSGALSAGASRTLPLASSSCNVPAVAQAYSLTFTVVPPGPVTYLTVWPTGVSRPVVSTLNDLTGTIVANAAIVPAGTAGSIDVFATGTTDLVVDINGYFAPAGAGGLSLYNLPPCRVLDTRYPSGSPPFTGSMDMEVIGAGCGGTNGAQAYVFNATVVPSGGLTYLTLWPQGAAQPTVSTLNALDGAITSNMAIVPTNTAEISAYASGPSATYLILDMSGYFAP